MRLHLKVLSEPTSTTRATMVQSMIDVYASYGISVEVASTETLNLPLLNDLDVGTCVAGATTPEQNQLFGNRNNAGANDLCVYFVRSTVPPLQWLRRTSGQCFGCRCHIGCFTVDDGP